MFFLVRGRCVAHVVAFCPALCFPDVPLPLLEVGEAIYSEKGNWAIVFVAVVGVEVYADIAVKVAQRGGRVKRLGMDKYVGESKLG
jgi:hypothetical protein